MENLYRDYLSSKIVNVRLEVKRCTQLRDKTVAGKLGGSRKEQKQFSEALMFARKSRGNSRIYNGFAKYSLWKRDEICTTRFRLEKEGVLC